MVILALFLFDWRTAVISLTAIPLSLVSAALVLHYWGATLNTMVIAGLVIALGEVVDDAIIDVENILRRLKLNRDSLNPQPAYEVVLHASLEVRSAVVYASLIVTLVFVPVLFLDGLAGSFFRPLAISYILAILASLLVALTVTPALSLILLAERANLDRGEPASDSAAQEHLSQNASALRRAAQRPAVAFLVIAFAATGLAVTQLGEEFLPNFQQETDFFDALCREGSSASLESMRRITILASKGVAGDSGVRNFGSHIGRAEVADEVVGPNFTELWISVDPDYDLAEVQKLQGASCRRWISRLEAGRADLS